MSRTKFCYGHSVRPCERAKLYSHCILIAMEVRQWIQLLGLSSQNTEVRELKNIEFVARISIHIHKTNRMTDVITFILLGAPYRPKTKRHPIRNLKPLQLHMSVWWKFVNKGYLVKMLYITVTSEWARWRLKSPTSPLFTQPFIRVQIKENIKAQRHSPLCGEFTGDRWIPRTNGQ